MTGQSRAVCPTSARGPRQRSQVWMIVLTSGLCAIPAVADDREASSVAEFVDAKERWDRLVGQPMRLEGRYTVFSASELRFRNCDMRFVLSKSFRRGSTKNVEVAGQIVRQNGGLVFRVAELKPRESDADMLARKRALIDNSRPDGAYDLADWARHRGDFYDDDELRESSNSLYLEGLTIAYQHLKPGDIAGLRELAQKAGEFPVEDGRQIRYLHEANRLEWNAELATQQPNYPRVLDRIRRELPGAMTPLPRHQLSIRKDYEKSPEAYRLANAQNRRLLDRAFYLEVGLANILQDATDDGRNGYAIAGRIERDLPELTELADTYRQQELRYLNARVTRLTRTQMLALAERYKERDNTPQANRVIRQWLQFRESPAREKGPTELMELGDEYVNLLNDERAAAKLYKLAYQQNPELHTSASWLRSHGYQLHESKWTKPGELEDDPDEAAMSEAIQEGRVRIGMTAEQVRQTLVGKPSSVIRMASAGQIDELWVFRDFEITVRFKRRSTAGTSRVVEINTID